MCWGTMSASSRAAPISGARTKLVLNCKVESNWSLKAAH